MKRRGLFSPPNNKKNLHELVGTLTHEESEEMQKLINKEFEKIVVFFNAGNRIMASRML